MIVNAHLIASPIQAVKFEGHQFFVKRDDLLNHHFSGNKARKLGYFLDHDFHGVKKILGHGSVQANSLLSIAALAHLKNWQLDFYVNRIPDWLKNKPLGNYRAAIELGANIIEVEQDVFHSKASNLDEYMRELTKSLLEDTLFIPEGGRFKLAKYGITKLANEIKSYCDENNLIHPIIMLPSGTGTTALFLQQLLGSMKVMTCACVGDSDYLKKQFAELSETKSDWPEILEPSKKYHFGKLYAEFYQLWKKLKVQTNIEFDLLYDPLGWLCLLDYLKNNQTNAQIIYIHQGGIVGNESMLPRYQRKYDE